MSTSVRSVRLTPIRRHRSSSNRHMSGDITMKIMMMMILWVSLVTLWRSCGPDSVQSFHLTQQQQQQKQIRNPQQLHYFNTHRYQSNTASSILSLSWSNRISSPKKRKFALNARHERTNRCDADIISDDNSNNNWTIRSIRKTAVSVLLTLSIVTGGTIVSGNLAPSTMVANAASDPSAIVGCLFQKCSVQLGKCIASPLCLANVVCINTCNNRPDEIECQIKCGDIFDNPAIAEFNKCAVSDMSCVPQQKDDGSYPVPSRDVTVPKFNTNFFNGRLYITAGQNPLFDIFPCQVHFFTETEPGKFFGKLNWRVNEPDGEYFTRDAVQEFYQDPNDPSHLINHDNEYLHYKDDWWIIDYEYENNEKGVPPFAFVYYRGSNDAWDGYGGVVVYTRDAALPKELIPRLREAAKKINYDFDKDFTITDNSCPAELSDGEKVLLREKFAGKTILQTEQQLQAAATRFRGNAVNSIKAQKLFFENRFDKANEAFATLEQSTKDFESEIKTSNDK